jgi:hypothetical protein
MDGREPGPPRDWHPRGDHTDMGGGKSAPATDAAPVRPSSHPAGQH